MAELVVALGGFSGKFARHLGPVEPMECVAFDEDRVQALAAEDLGKCSRHRCRSSAG